ncbi:MoxR family ATPase [Rhodovarius crocodyli]|uniref:MoxR family ATPase n=1 Tax=Rhodovarius crocodyli TaxID=1979269 RepID=A0A437MNB8_9PROT|nr:MoxR family ATPase [Rhodovarius crocodyli]RVT99136.1 MoxR family ATPase [Rhodovarius crocodyli]
MGERTDVAAMDQAMEMASQAEAIADQLVRVREEVGKVILGQEGVIEQVTVTILSGGHVLLVGVPGLGKTKLVETLAVVLGLDARRVQFTPDLMPADILGSEVLEEAADGRRSFRFIKGPVFCQLLMADEINRASPRTQSALLQSMQEGRVAIGGEVMALPRPFHVLATQNPIEQEGTYPLPEAQLDRFLLEVEVRYPDEAAERQMLLATTGAQEAQAVPVLSGQDLMAAQALVRRLPVPDDVVTAILRLVRGARPDSAASRRLADSLAWGPGPRAAQALMLATRARALFSGRLAPSVDDVIALAEPVLRHRMALTFSARADGVTISSLIDELKATIG